MMPPDDNKPTGKSVALALDSADAAAKASPTANATVSAIQPCTSSIRIEGSEEFKSKTRSALAEIASTKSGAALLASIQNSGKTVTIEETMNGNACGGFTRDALVKADGSPGSGSSSIVRFNPDRTSIGQEAWQTRPAAIGLAHELVHASHGANGSVDLRKEDNDSRPDPADLARIAQEKHEEVRTVGIPPYENEPYSENSIRNEWSTKQPPRPWY